MKRLLWSVVVAFTAIAQPTRSSALDVGPGDLGAMPAPATDDERYPGSARDPDADPGPAPVLTQSTGAVVPAPDEPASGAIDMGAAASNRFSLLPWTTNGFVGLNLGRPRYDTGCGAGFDCGNPPISLHLYTGGMVTNYFGIELGYVDFNRAHRAGGETRAQGLDIDALARAPLGPLGVFAQAGATAGRTVVTAEPAAGLGTGREYGWGANYGAGASYNFLGNSSVVLQWDRNDFRFASGGRGVRDISLGYLYRF